VVADDMGLPVADFKRQTPSEFEVTSNGSMSENGQNPHRYDESTVVRLQTGDGPTDVDADGDVDQDPTSSSETASASSSSPAEPSERENVSDVVEFGNGGLAVNEEQPWKFQCTECGSDEDLYRYPGLGFRCPKHAPSGAEFVAGQVAQLRELR
jgi:hypothetical protein